MVTPADFAVLRTLPLVDLDAARIDRFRSKLTGIISFIDDTYLPDSGFRTLVGMEQVILRNVAL